MPYLYLISGETPSRDEDGTLRLEYSHRAYRYDPLARTGRWSRMGDLPRPVAAGSSLEVGQSHVLVFSGSQGSRAGEGHPGFSERVLVYHTITDTWIEAGAMPTGVVTTAAVWWRGRIVIPSGEVRPGVRTPEVQSARLESKLRPFGVLNYSVLVLYLGLLLLIGACFAHREKSTADFFLAGRRIPVWAAGISIFATQLSAITYLSAPAVAFTGNWLLLPSWITILLMAPLVVRFYLPFFRRLEVTTAYEYLELRFDLKVRLLGSASFIAFQLARMAIVLFLTALAGSAATLCALILAAVDVQSIFFLFQSALGLVSSGLVGVFMLGIFTERANSRGVIAGAASAVCVLGYLAWFTELNFYWYAVFGTMVSVSCGYLASATLRGAAVRNLRGLTCWSIQRNHKE